MYGRREECVRRKIGIVIKNIQKSNKGIRGREVRDRERKITATVQDGTLKDVDKV